MLPPRGTLSIYINSFLLKNFPIVPHSDQTLCIKT